MTPRRLVFLAALLAGGRLAAAAPTPEYLQRWGRALDPASGAGTELIDTRGGALFLLGEVHGVAATNDADLCLLRSLQRRAGVRGYVSEISAAHAAAINRFLASGDERILDFLFAHMGHTSDRSADKRRFWVRLRSWNLSLPPSERVRVIGVDLERFDPEISLAELRRYFPELPGARGEASLRSLVAVMEGRDRTERSDWTARFGAGAVTGIELELSNLRERLECAADRSHYDELREAAQCRNFLRIAGSLGIDRFYGRMGSAHVLQRPVDGCDRFSARLEAAGPPWSGHLVGIWPVYHHCEELAYRGGAYRAVPCDEDPQLGAPLASAARGPLTLFRLDAPGSPFRTPFQYALLFQDSPAAEKLIGP